MKDRMEVHCPKCGATTFVDPQACEAYGWPLCCGEIMSKERPMRVIIAGSRSITEQSLVDKAVKESGFRIDVVISGGARGVDSLGEEWAARNGKPVRRFLPDWERYGKSAGFIRNDLMVRNADALVAITNGSRGTTHTISVARRKGIPVHVMDVSERPPVPRQDAKRRGVSMNFIEFLEDQQDQQARGDARGDGTQETGDAGVT